MWGIYNLLMISLLVIGSALIIKSAYVATGRGLATDQIVQAVLGLVIFGVALSYWASGTPQLIDEVPRYLYAVFSVLIGYGANGVVIWALDPELAKKIT